MEIKPCLSPETDGIRRRKRGPSIKLFGNELCQICNRKADGYHYNVLSCQGCKGFYRRTIMMKAEYICRTGRGDCDLTEADHPRKRCQKCRLEKCEAAGMCEKYVRKRKNRTRTVRILENMRRPTVIVESLTPHQIRLLDEAMKAWNHLSDQRLIRPIICHDQYDTRLLSFIEKKLELLVRFCIALDYFRDLPLEDQVTVISRTIIELFTLHSIPHYDPIGETVRTFTGDAVDQYTMEDVTGDEFSSSLFYVLKKAMRCKMNASMASMLTCITLFSPDRDYKNELNEILSQIQDHYVTLLRRYCERHFGDRAFRRFSRILDMLPSLRETRYKPEANFQAPIINDRMTEDGENVFAMRLQQNSVSMLREMSRSSTTPSTSYGDPLSPSSESSG